MKADAKTVVGNTLPLSVLALNLALAHTCPAASFIKTGSLSGARAGHTATLLPNGLVLVMGGFNGIGPDRVSSAELFDASTRQWTATGSLGTGRTGFASTLLPN